MSSFLFFTSKSTISDVPRRSERAIDGQKREERWCRRKRLNLFDFFFFSFPRRSLAASLSQPLSTVNLDLFSTSTSLLNNQAVLSTFGFHFIYSLTLIHTLTTLAGMKAFQAAGKKEKEEGKVLEPFFCSHFRRLLLTSLAQPFLPPLQTNLIPTKKASTRRKSSPKRPWPRWQRPTSATSSSTI